MAYQVHSRPPIAADVSVSPYPFEARADGPYTGGPSTTRSANENPDPNGEPLSPSSVERHLSSLPLVQDCAALSGQALGYAASGSGSGSASAPTVYVVLSHAARERVLSGGEKEAKKVKLELNKVVAGCAPTFAQRKGKVVVVDSIPRSPSGAVLRKDLVEKSTVPPAPPTVPAGPSKGFFTTVLASTVSTSAATATGDAHNDEPTSRRTGRDSKRRATHSQIERRRREKINDRLVTLRSIVPACSRELEERRRARVEEEREAARIAAGGAPKVLIDAATGKPKRKRNRKKPEPKSTAREGGAEKDEELVLHKLEVLTHAIDYIFELKARIVELETGVRPERIGTADDPFGKGEAAAAAGVEGLAHRSAVDGSGSVSIATGNVEVAAEATATRPRQSADAFGAHVATNAHIHDDDDDDESQGSADQPDDPEPHAKRRTSTSTRGPPVRTGIRRTSLATRTRRTHAADSSGSSRDSAETSPATTLPRPSPLPFSPASHPVLTSPMMSLSAESPLLLADPASKRSDALHRFPAHFHPLPPAALPLSPDPPSRHHLPSPAARRDSSSFLFTHLSLASPPFPPLRPSTYGTESDLRNLPPSSTSTPDPDPDPPSATAAAAALLLNFSTSPEVLRPVSALRSATRPGPRIPLAPRTDHRPPDPSGFGLRPLGFSTPQVRPLRASAATGGIPSSAGPGPGPGSQWDANAYERSGRIPGSAPGGSRPTLFLTSTRRDGDGVGGQLARAGHEDGGEGYGLGRVRKEDEQRKEEEEEEEDELLHSPPLLALDDGLVAEERREEDAASDETVEDVCRVPMLVD